MARASRRFTRFLRAWSRFKTYDLFFKFLQQFLQCWSNHVSNTVLREAIGCSAVKREPYICSLLLHLDFLIHPRVITKDFRCQHAAAINFWVSENLYSTRILEIHKFREAITPKIMGRNCWNFMWGCIKGRWVAGLIFKKIETTFFPSTKVSFFLIFAFIIIQHV